MKILFTVDTESQNDIPTLKRLLELFSLPSGSTIPIANHGPHSPAELSLLLQGNAEDLVRFFVLNDGEVYNDDLAKELSVKQERATAPILGGLTSKLVKTGTDAHEWYRKIRAEGRTVLRLRPDVLELFKAAIDFKDNRKERRSKTKHND